MWSCDQPKEEDQQPLDASCVGWSRWLSLAGLKFQATVPLNHFDEEVCATVLKQLWP